MNPTSPVRIAFKQDKARFAGQSAGLPGWVGAVDVVMQPLQSSRFRQMMVEDIFGFALPRTVIDTYRQYLFQDTYNKKRELNLISGRERLMMELMGTLQCGVGLISAAGAAMWAGKSNGLSHHFLSYDTMDYWQEKLQDAKLRSAKDGAKLLARDIQAAAPAKLTAASSEKVGRLLESAMTGKLKTDEAATLVARLFAQEHMHVKLGKQLHSLPALFEESRAFLQHIGQTSPARFGLTGLKRMEQIHQLKRWTIPAAVLFGFTYNFLSPTIIHKLTRKVDHLEEYPGEMGLRELHRMDPQHSQQQKPEWFPYLKSSLYQGNVLPLLINAIPLLTLGFFDTQKLAQQGPVKAWTGAFRKGFFNRFLRLYDFSKLFPYTTGQQISSIYGMLVLSRMATARDGVEFRERSIDAMLGWSFWMLANPWLSKKFGQWSDKASKTRLMKQVGSEVEMKSRAEIEKLIKNPALRQRTLRNFVKINFLSLMGTILLLGIVEPYLSIKLTEWQTRKQHARETRLAQQLSR